MAVPQIVALFWETEEPLRGRAGWRKWVPGGDPLKVTSAADPCYTLFTSWSPTVWQPQPQVPVTRETIPSAVLSPLGGVEAGPR